MLKSLLIVGTGSFIGGAMRYLLSTYMKNVCGQGFPWGTLSVNLLGCFLFGILFAIFNKNASTDNTLYLLLTTGDCDGSNSVCQGEFQADSLRNHNECG